MWRFLCEYKLFYLYDILYCTSASLQTGLVKVTVRTQGGRLLLVTSFQYVDCSTLDVLKQLVKDPALQSLLFSVWSQEQSIFGSSSVDAQNQGPSTMQDQGKKWLLISTLFK